MTPTFTYKPTQYGTYELYQDGNRISTSTLGAITAAHPEAKLDAGSGAGVTPSSVQQTTTGLRTVANENNTKLDTKLSLIAPKVDPNAQNQQQIQQQQQQNGIQQNGATSLNGTVVNDIDNGDGTHTVSYADGTQDRVKVGANPDGSASYTTLTPEAGLKYDADQATTAAKAKAQAQTDYANTTLDSIKAMSDTSTAALIDSIKQTFAARISLMDDTNSRTLAAKTQEGVRSGRARYAAGLQEGILTDEEQQGIGRVAQLQGQMLSLVQQAQSAQTDKDLDLFNTRMKDLSDIDTQLQNEVQNIQKNAFDQLKQMQDQKTADINNAKTQQQMVLDKAKSVAPAIADQLATLTDPKAQADFLEAYSKSSGLDMDILLGAVQDQQTDDAKSKLDLENIQNEIENRDASTRISGARLKLDQDKANKAVSDDGTDEVNNIINGVSTLGDVDAKKKEAVKAQLQAKGLYDDTPPSWYVQAQNDLAGQTLKPSVIKDKWDTYRNKAIADDSAE